METVVEILREVLRGAVRELSAYYFRKNVLENKKPPRVVASKRVAFKNNIL